MTVVDIVPVRTALRMSAEVSNVFVEIMLELWNLTRFKDVM